MVIIKSENNENCVYINGEKRFKLTDLRGLELNKKYDLTLNDFIEVKSGYYKLKTVLKDIYQNIIPKPFNYNPWDSYLGKQKKIS